MGFKNIIMTSKDGDAYFLLVSTKETVWLMQWQYRKGQKYSQNPLAYTSRVATVV